MPKILGLGQCILRTVNHLGIAPAPYTLVPGFILTGIAIPFVPYYKLIYQRRILMTYSRPEFVNQAIV